MHIADGRIIKSDLSPLIAAVRETVFLALAPANVQITFSLIPVIEAADEIPALLISRGCWFFIIRRRRRRRRRRVGIEIAVL